MIALNDYYIEKHINNFIIHILKATRIKRECIKRKKTN